VPFFFDVTNVADPTGQITLEFRDTNPDQDIDWYSISLDGLPPGVPVTRILDVPMGTTGVASVLVSLAFDMPGSFDEVYVIAEVTGDASPDFAATQAAHYVTGTGMGPGTSYCTAAPNSTGQGAMIAASGTSSIANNNLVLDAQPIAPSQPGIFFYGPNETEVPFGNGFLCIAGQVWRLPVSTADATGQLQWALDLTMPPANSGGGEIIAGATWKFQAWYRDPAAGGAFFNLSDGVSVLFMP
jgi:hypothetical protein